MPTCAWDAFDYPPDPRLRIKRLFSPLVRYQYEHRAAGVAPNLDIAEWNERRFTTPSAACGGCGGVYSEIAVPVACGDRCATFNVYPRRNWLTALCSNVGRFFGVGCESICDQSGVAMSEATHKVFDLHCCGDVPLRAMPHVPTSAPVCSGALPWQMVKRRVVHRACRTLPGVLAAMPCDEAQRMTRSKKQMVDWARSTLEDESLYYDYGEGDGSDALWVGAEISGMHDGGSRPPTTEIGDETTIGIHRTVVRRTPPPPPTRTARVPRKVLDEILVKLNMNTDEASKNLAVEVAKALRGHFETTLPNTRVKPNPYLIGESLRAHFGEEATPADFVLVGCNCSVKHPELLEPATTAEERRRRARQGAMIDSEMPALVPLGMPMKSKRSVASRKASLGWSRELKMPFSEWIKTQQKSTQHQGYLILEDEKRDRERDAENAAVLNSVDSEMPPGDNYTVDEAREERRLMRALEQAQAAQRKAMADAKTRHCEQYGARSEEVCVRMNEAEKAYFAANVSRAETALREYRANVLGHLQEVGISSEMPPLVPLGVEYVSDTVEERRLLRTLAQAQTAQRKAMAEAKVRHCEQYGARSEEVCVRMNEAEKAQLAANVSSAEQALRDYRTNGHPEQSGIDSEMPPLVDIGAPYGVSKISGINALNALRKTSAGRAVVVKFTASWCKPCKDKNFTTNLAALVSEWGARGVVFVEVDADEDAAAASSIQTAYSVEALPSFLVFGAAAQPKLLTGTNTNSLRSELTRIVGGLSSEMPALVPLSSLGSEMPPLVPIGKERKEPKLGLQDPGQAYKHGHYPRIVHNDTINKDRMPSLVPLDELASPSTSIDAQMPALVPLSAGRSLPALVPLSRVPAAAASSPEIGVAFSETVSATESRIKARSPNGVKSINNFMPFAHRYIEANTIGDPMIVLAPTDDVFTREHASAMAKLEREDPAQFAAEMSRYVALNPHTMPTAASPVSLQMLSGATRTITHDRQIRGAVNPQIVERYKFDDGTLAYAHKNLFAAR